jgi:hypothetical protein
MTVAATTHVLQGGTRQTRAALGLYAGPSAAPLVSQGLLPPAPSDTSSFQLVPPPGLRTVRNEAQATMAPWVDSNGWRFQRGIVRANYEKLPAGAAPLAAAEAFAFGVEAILNPDPADLDELGRLLGVLGALERRPMPALANIGVVDDGSPAMGDVLNMLTRRNLLYRIVSREDRSLDLTMDVGTPAFPRDRLMFPSDLAARAREALGDDRRIVRLYGTTTVIARLTGDAARTRLYLLSYSRNRNQPGIRIRLLGRHQPASLTAFGAAAGAAVADLRHPDNAATEFSVPAFSTIAIVDLERIR